MSSLISSLRNGPLTNGLPYCVETEPIVVPIRMSKCDNCNQESEYNPRCSVKDWWYICDECYPNLHDKYRRYKFFKLKEQEEDYGFTITWKES